MGNKQPKPEISEEQKNTTLSEYFEYLYSTHLIYKRSDEEVQAIKEAVRELVYYISIEIGKVDSRFAIRRTMLVGSMLEGTSNGEPYEFDFILVIDSLSLSNEIKLVRKCRDKPGFVHLVLKEDSSAEFKSTWGDIIKQGQLRSTETGLFTHGIRDRFRETLTKAMKILQNKNLKLMKSRGTLEIYNKEPQKHGPACVVTFIWTPVDQTSSSKLYISVDMTVAVQFADITTVIQVDEVDNKKYFRELQESGVFMTITGGESTCSKGLCHRLTFTNTEVRIMAGISDQHKKCYRILKYIFNGVNSNANIANLIFHSYSIKTFVLKHVLVCDRQPCEVGGLAMCILEVLKDIEICLFEKQSKWYSREFCITVPCILLPSHNIFHRQMKNNLLNANVKGFQAMKKSIERISELELAESTDERIALFRKHAVIIASYYVPDGVIHTFTLAIGPIPITIRF